MLKSQKLETSENTGKQLNQATYLVNSSTRAQHALTNLLVKAISVRLPQGSIFTVVSVFYFLQLPLLFPRDASAKRTYTVQMAVFFSFLRSHCGFLLSTPWVTLAVVSATFLYTCDPLEEACAGFPKVTQEHVPHFCAPIIQVCPLFSRLFCLETNVIQCTLQAIAVN